MQSWMLLKRNLWKNKENTQKMRLKVKTISMTYPEDSNVRVSNYIKSIDIEHFVFILQEDYKVLNKIKMDRDWKGNILQKKL